MVRELKNIDFSSLDEGTFQSWFCFIGYHNTYKNLCLNIAGTGFSAAPDVYSVTTTGDSETITCDTELEQYLKIF